MSAKSVIEKIHLSKQIFTTSLLVLCTTISPLLLAYPAHAVTFTNDYPDMDATNTNNVCSNSFGIYSWCKEENDIQGYQDGEQKSSRNFYYRNCVDGAAYWVKQYTSVTIPGSWGSAINWDNAATSYTVKDGAATNSIEPGDIAQSDDGGGGYGHVGFVTSVSKDSNGSVTSIVTAELNGAGTGLYSTPTYSSKNASGKFIRSGSNDWDHFIDVNGANTGLNNEVLASGGAYGTDTIGVFNPAAAEFNLRNSMTPGSADATVQHGQANWLPVPGDWDGDGDDTVGVFDPTTATFHLRNSNTQGSSDAGDVQFGGGGFIPLAGDWDGIGSDGIGVYDPVTTNFYLKNVISQGNPDVPVFQFGGAGRIPVVGDWDGNGTDTIGVYDPTTAMFYLRNTNDNGPAVAIQFGAGGWKPVVGDWDGNGTTTIGVFNPTTATFYWRNDNSGGPSETPIQFGAGGWKPVAGDWNGQ